MTYYADSGEYLFEFDTSECDTYTNYLHMFADTAVQADQFGHWDVLWQNSGSTATDCTQVSQVVQVHLTT